jgi:hypothetical protein
MSNCAMFGSEMWNLGSVEIERDSEARIRRLKTLRTTRDHVSAPVAARELGSEITGRAALRTHAGATS